MHNIFNKTQNSSWNDEERPNPSSSTFNVGPPSTSQIPDDSAINPDLVTTPVVKRPSGSPGEKKKRYLAAGITVLKHLKEISEARDLLAPLKAARGATTAILETIEAMDSNKEAWKNILQTIQRHQRTFEHQLKNMDAQQVLPDAEPGLLDPIKEYGQDLEAILGALMLENGISTATVPDESKFRSLITFMKQYGTVKVETETISGYNNQLDDAMNQFTASMAVYMGFKLHSIGQKLHSVSQDLQKLILNSSTTNKESKSGNEIKLEPRQRLVPNFMGREGILDARRRAQFDSLRVEQQAPGANMLCGIESLRKAHAAQFAPEFEKKHLNTPANFLDASTAKKQQADPEAIIRARERALFDRARFTAAINPYGGNFSRSLWHQSHLLWHQRRLPTSARHFATAMQLFRQAISFCARAFKVF